MADDDNTRPVDPDASTADLGKPSSAALPRKIGNYSIKRIIASGGMGTVYLAQQESPRRVVALKVMKKGLASRSALRRFEYESQILGRLKHPNIALVYEAGTHDDGEGGVPYFAMEYIANAKTITEYVKTKKLGMRERLELFAKVCDAIHHGHQKGIIHRDLKPGNILVDSQGEPKIIDFGVARATDSDMAITTLQTDIGQLIGTLQYMSPEQCEGDPHDLDTRSDVYALGVVFYELLTEQLPYDISQVAMFEAARVIRDEHPTKMSTINPRLRGDVETIALKALEKDRERRYKSTETFGSDIQRYLDGHPIEARPVSAFYRFRKFAARNKGRVIVWTSVLAVLLLATPISLFASWYIVDSAQKLQELRRRDLRSDKFAQIESEFYNHILEAYERVIGSSKYGYGNRVSVFDDIVWSKIVYTQTNNDIEYQRQSLYAMEVEIDNIERHVKGSSDTIIAVRTHVEAYLRVTLAIGYCRFREYDSAVPHTSWLYSNDRPEDYRWYRPGLMGYPTFNLGLDHADTLRLSGKVEEASLVLEKLMDSLITYENQSSRLLMNIQVRLLGLSVRIHLAQGNFERARSDAEKYVEINQDALHYIVKYQLSRQSYEAAVLLFLTTVRRLGLETSVSDDLSNVMDQANASKASGRFIEPGRLILYRLMADEDIAAALLRLGDDVLPPWREIQEFQLAKAGDPNASVRVLKAAAWDLLTNEHAELRDPARALPLAQRAVDKVGGNDPAILVTLALAQHLTGDTAAAIETQKTALSLLPADARFRGDYEAALAKYEAALKDEVEKMTHPGRK